MDRVHRGGPWTWGPCFVYVHLKDKANRVTAIVEEAQGKCKLWHKIFFRNFPVP